MAMIQKLEALEFNVLYFRSNSHEDLGRTVRTSNDHLNFPANFSANFLRILLQISITLLKVDSVMF